MAEDSGFAFTFPAVRGRKITAAFDGGRLTSDGGVLLLAQAERRLGIADRLAACIADPRDQGRVIHRVADILRARMLAIACGYEDADDLDALRHDPGFKLALGKLPEGPVGLASQPTMSRWENAPTTRELVRLTGALVDLYCASYPAPPAAVTLDIDDTVDVVHGAQQLSFWNGHYGERCFLPIHVYDTATGRPVAMLLRTGKTPLGKEVAGHVRRLVRRIRRHWPDARITLRGDSHYGRPEPMAWRGERRRLYLRPVRQSHAPPCRSRHRHRSRCLRHRPRAAGAGRAAPLCRDALCCQAMGSDRAPRGRPDRGEPPRPSHLGFDIRFVVTSLATSSAEQIYDTLYCARGVCQVMALLENEAGRAARTHAITTCRRMPDPFSSCRFQFFEATATAACCDTSN